MDALRVVSDIRSISPLTGINAILVRDTPERLQVAGRFLSAFDKAKPELVVDVEILEVDRTKLLEYGLQLASPGSPGIDGAAIASTPTNLTAKSIQSLTSAEHPAVGHPGALLPAAEDRHEHADARQSASADVGRRRRPRRSSASASPRRTRRSVPSRRAA